jgi:DNA-binding XRE family transcriptional regulator
LIVNNRVFREIREQKLISKGELSRKANVAPQTITNLEEGRKIRMDTIIKVIGALGLSQEDAKTNGLITIE